MAMVQDTQGEGWNSPPCQSLPMTALTCFNATTGVNHARGMKFCSVLAAERLRAYVGWSRWLRHHECSGESVCVSKP
jgi:hypothetical protein